MLLQVISGITSGDTFMHNFALLNEQMKSSQLFSESKPDTSDSYKKASSKSNHSKND